MSNNPIGIDLGTTYSSAGILKPSNKVDIVPFSTNKYIPSHVFFDPNTDEIVVGTAAKYKIRNIENEIFDSKRIIGSKYDDYAVQDGMKNWPFKVINDNGLPKIEVTHNKRIEHYSPQDISTIILKEIKKYSDSFLGKNPDNNTKTKAVISVPAYFNNIERENTRKAAENANLEVIKIINEPTAAAIAYAYQSIDINGDEIGKRKMLIYDFGGGTFDLSLIELDGKNKTINVLGTDGDSYLGGEDIDNIMVDYFIGLYEKEGNSKKDINKKRIKLKKECEKAKEMFSSSDNPIIDCDFLEDAGVNCEISLAEFEKLIKDICDKTIILTEKLISDMELKPKDIDDVILVGGSSRIRKVQELLTKLFGEDKIRKDINASEVVAYGATIVANIKKFDFTVYDVVTHSLSTEIDNNKLHKMIKKNTKIPCEYSANFANMENNQDIITVDVYEGEGDRIGDKRTKLLGYYEFRIPRAPARTIIINIKYKVDEDGIIHVYGKLNEDKNEKELMRILSNYEIVKY